MLRHSALHYYFYELIQIHAECFVQVCAELISFMYEVRHLIQVHDTDQLHLYH
jgi:hypothetical protein